jgi:hypothetical protein
MKTTACAVLVIAFAAAAGCGGGGSSSSGQTVGPAGGTVRLGNEVVLTIPAGALAAQQTITIARSGSAPSGFSAFSAQYELGPAGLTFQKPATVQIGYSGQDDQARLFWNPGSAWQELDESSSRGISSASVTQLGRGFVGWQPDLVGSGVVAAVGESGPRDRGLDLTTGTVAATDGAGAVHSGAGAADGSFQIAGVPSGTSVIQVGSDYFVTRKRVLDLGFTTFGRADAARPAATTNVSLNVQNLAAWTSGRDELEVVSPGAGFVLDDPETTAIAAGATGDTLSFDALALGAALPSGDTLFVNQLQGRTGLDQTPYAALTRSGSLPAQTWTAGAANSAAVPLASLSALSTVDISFDPSFFLDENAQALLFGANAAPSARLVSIQALPGGNKLGVYAAVPPDLLFVSPPVNAASVHLGPVSYANPYPGDWGVFAVVEKDYFVSYKAPGATTAVSASAGALSQFDVAGLSAPVALTLGPVQNVTVDGHAAVTPVPPPVNATTPPVFVSATPTVSFDRPASGAARRYEIRVHLLSNAGGASAETVVGRIALEARLFPAKVSAALPAGLLSSGNTYFLEIEASTDSSAAPRRNSLPSSRSIVLTAPLSVP